MTATRTGRRRRGEPVITRGLRTAVYNNGPAYGFSIMITASYAVLAARVGDAAVGDVFLYALSAVAAFVAVEAIASNLFRQRIRGDPPETVMLGTAFAFFSVGCGIGTAALVGLAIGGPGAWPVGGFLATLVYVSAVGGELALAHRAEARAGPPEEEPATEDEPAAGDE